MTRSVEECTKPSLGPEPCANEGCTRLVERGERWCPTCGLERAMYRRDARRPGPAEPERPSGREAGRR